MIRGLFTLVEVMGTVKQSFDLFSPREKRVYALLVSGRIFLNFLDVLGVALVGVLASFLTTGVPSQELSGIFRFEIFSGSTRDLIWQIAVAVAVIFLAKSALSALLLRKTLLFLATIEARVSLNAVTWIHSGGLGRFKSSSRGQVFFAAEESSQQAISGLLSALAIIMSEGTLFFAMFIVFLLVDAPAAIISTIYLATIVVSYQLVVGKRITVLGEIANQSHIRVSNLLNDLNVAFRELTVSRSTHRFLARFAGARLTRSRALASHGFLMAVPRYLIESSLMIGVLGLVGWQVFLGDASEGLVTVAVFLAGGVKLTAAILPVQNAFSNLRFYSIQAEPAQRFARRGLRESPDPDFDPRTEINSPETFSAPEPALSVSMRDVGFTHLDSETPVLESINIEIEPGSFAAIIGPSGAGKSSIVDLMIGLETPSHGKVEIGGISPSERLSLNPGSIGYVSQTPGFVRGTIAENVALGLESHEISVERVRECLRLAQLDTFVNTLENGVATVLRDQASSLSGGQRQRLGLARALYSRPSVLLLDEATSSLDAKTEAGATEAVMGLTPETTLVVIAHRLSTVRNADLIFFVDGGQIVSSGTLEVLRERVPAVRDYIELMAI